MKRIVFIVCMAVIFGISGIVLQAAAQESADYKYRETKDLVSLVRDAAGVVSTKGEEAFAGFKKDGSPWKTGETYIFVFDTAGNMVEHPDSSLEGKNQIDMKDANGKPVTKGIIDATASDTNRNEGWFHYQWPKPGAIFASWKSAFAKRVVAPSGKVYIVCSGLYDPKMEDVFLINAVNSAVSLIEKDGKKAFDTLRDKSSQFVFLGTYIFVDTPEGVEEVNGGFPDIEGKNILDYKDANGKYVTREIVDTAVKKGSGWVDYLWPKPGELKASPKHTYVKKAVSGTDVFAVGAGSYTAEAADAVQESPEDIAGQVMMLELKSGEKAAGKIIRQTKDSIFIENMDGTMEVSFPLARVTKIRKPTDAELQKINNELGGSQKAAAKEKK